LAANYVIEKDKDKIVQMIFDKNFDLRNKIILEESIFPKINLADDKNAKIEIKKYTPNQIILRTDSETDMLLFISDNYYPGWKVSIDGEFGKIYRADYSFRAVPVLKGAHEVEFLYSPYSFKLGLWISAISFFCMLTILVILKKGKNVG
jgi:uncharacterized membrane protein YfhO